MSSPVPMSMMRCIIILHHVMENEQSCAYEHDEVHDNLTTCYREWAVLSIWAWWGAWLSYMSWRMDSRVPMSMMRCMIILQHVMEDGQSCAYEHDEVYDYFTTCHGECAVSSLRGAWFSYNMSWRMSSLVLMRYMILSTCHICGQFLLLVLFTCQCESREEYTRGFWQKQLSCQNPTITYYIHVIINNPTGMSV